jgi:hypothetical protein
MYSDMPISFPQKRPVKAFYSLRNSRHASFLLTPSREIHRNNKALALILSSHSGTPIWVTLGGVVGFALLMIYGVQRLLKGFATSFEKRSELSENMVAFILVLVLGSALCTESLGIQLLFGFVPGGRDHAQGAEVRALST